MELNEEKDKSKKLQNIINDLNNTISQLKKKNVIDNKKYDEEIKSYMKKIEVTNNHIKKITLENNNLKNEIKKVKEQNNSNNSDKMLKLYEKIEKLNEKIEELNEKIKRYPFIIEKGERMFSIIFQSATINYSMICKNTDTIHKLELELYNQYPDLSKTNNFFLCKGNYLDKYEELEKYHLKNSDIIIVNQSEF